MALPKVAICTPFHHTVNGTTYNCAFNLAAYSAQHCSMLMIRSSGCYIEDNRNGAVQAAIEFEAARGIALDWMLWIDGDMEFPPDALTRLIAHDKDIVGANYRVRTPPHGFCAHYLDGMDTHLMEPGLHRMSHIPTGLMLVRFEVLRRMQYPWFKPGLHNEPRDDVYFCNEARKAGREIWCDHDLTREVVHDGIPWFTADQIKVVDGAELNIPESRAAMTENVRSAAA